MGHMADDEESEGWPSGMPLPPPPPGISMPPPPPPPPLQDEAVEAPIDDTPAQRAGIEAGDMIIKVDEFTSLALNHFVSSYFVQQKLIQAL